MARPHEGIEYYPYDAPNTPEQGAHVWGVSVEQAAAYLRQVAANFERISGRQPLQNGKFLFFDPVSCVASFCEGWRPVVLGDANPHGMANAIFFSCFWFNISAVREIQNEVS